MVKGRNAYQNWIFFTAMLVLHTAIISHRNLVYQIFHAWATPATIPVIALSIIFLIRIAMKAGDWIADLLKKARIPAWLLFILTTAAYIWMANWIEIGG